MEKRLKELLRTKSRNKCKYFYNIMPIENIPSVVENGILSFYKVKQQQHTSIALEGVQERREKVKIPNGGKLHSYANVYFCFNNPMMYKRKDIAEKLCILAVDTSILNIEGCIIADQNAATDLVKFYTPEEGINNIDFDLIFAQYWSVGDYYDQRRRKAIKCAEILVPDCIPYEYIISACVLNKEAEQKMLSYGFNKNITIKTSPFFR
ncbi:MAG: DUF4433 domain-containing protein [Ruminococcus sp.]|nr:DUF4433 domain-containing protein [Ruminococcus sp.]